jgi:hypothetical protein
MTSPRETARSRPPPRDRRGAGLAIGSLGRSVTDLLATLQELEHLGVGFVSLTEALDLTTPAGRAMAAMLAVFAAFEREVLQERTRAGLAHARANGKRLGRPATAAVHAAEIRKLHRAGVSKSEIARLLVAVADGAIMAGPMGATPPTVDGTEWPHAESKKTGFRKRITSSYADQKTRSIGARSPVIRLHR